MAFCIKEEQPQRPGCTAGCPAKQSPALAPAYPTPRLGKGQEMSPGENWTLSLSQTLWGKGSCFSACRDDTFAPSPQEHTDCGLSLFAGCGGPVPALEAPGV